MPKTDLQATWPRLEPDWESFYRDYRKPGYIPGYVLRAKLGAGSFGIVFRAEKESIGKAYAVKFLRVEEPALLRLAIRELQAIRTMASLDHPNLVSIEDQGIRDGIPYIVMAFAGEETLKSRIEEGPLAPDECDLLFPQVLHGVRELHRHSIVHFDLKPSNIFLKGDAVRIGDYGLSKILSESQGSLSIRRGTPHYMAPELLKRKGDFRSDIYSLGVLLFECLTGHLPFDGENEWEILKAHEESEPSFPPSLPDTERGILEKCLAKAPDARFSSVDELLEAFRTRTRRGTAPVPETRADGTSAAEEGSEAERVREPPALAWKPEIALHPVQEEAVRAPSGPLRIVAGPGSGKTRVLTERIRFFVEDGRCAPWEILAVTFTVKATHEMCARLKRSLEWRSSAISVQTLHSLALSIAKLSPAEAGLPRPYEIETPRTRKTALILKTVERLRRRDPEFPPFLLDPQNALDAITALKHREPLRLLEGEDSPEVELCRTFDDIVREAHILLFDDFSLAALRLLRSNPEIRDFCRRKYKAVFVDEFQDLDAAQFLLVKELAGLGESLTVVGDDDQCIFTWRGADPSYLRDFERLFEGTRTLHLPVNYRSSPAVVEAAAQVIAHNHDRIPKKQTAIRTEGRDRILVRRHASVDEEVAFVCREVARLLEAGTEPAEIGVLARNNDLVQSFRLEARTADIPIQAENPLSREPGRSVLHLLRRVLEGPRSSSFPSILNLGRSRMPFERIGSLSKADLLNPEDIEGFLRSWAEEGREDDPAARSLRTLFAALDRAGADLLSQPPLPVLEALFPALDLPETVCGDPERDRLQEACALVLEVARRHGGTAGPEAFAGVITEVEELSFGDGGLAGESVHVLTIHRAKGLEFDHVFMLGAQNGIFPHRKIEYDRLEEERRLFYVGMTRARASLTLTNHRGVPHAPPDFEEDGFIAEIPKGLLEFDDEALPPPPFTAARSKAARGKRGGRGPGGKK